ncbi:MAG: hypothetical protein A3D97_07255 [Nitrospinae bacterium RIFCSPHIGHO2_12_FULL_39_42]|nr:MAG: hypothetical protein A3D97_07255 [Nitrospinae bacterium RIFCSPHIGHO2_12_FULL_39_42]
MGGLPAGQDPKCETVTTKDLRDEKWHFVAVVRDTVTNQFKFFIDHGNCTSLPCVPDKTVTNGAGSGTHTITGTVEFGRKNGYTGCSNPDPCSQEYFRGTIDNLAIYNYAMTDAEVNIHHFLYPSEAWASDTSGSGSGIQANDSVTILFNGETGATAINDLTTLNNALKLPTGKTWGTAFGSAVWSTTYYTNDTLKITLGSGANMAVGDTITLGDVILDVHSNPISGSIAITGSFAVNVPIGAIAYWTFNEGINDTVGDSVGSYSGTRYNGLGTWITGKFGSALDFTGTIGYVSLTNAVQLSSYNEWTIEAWFYGQLPTNGDNTNTLLIDTNTQHIVVMSVSGTRYLGVYSTADGGGFRSSGYSGMDSLSSTQWHHLVAVGKNSKTYFYIDGSPVGTAANYQPTQSISKLGNGRNASAEFKRPWGKIDDMVIYKRALSSSEISLRAAR